MGAVVDAVKDAVSDIAGAVRDFYDDAIDLAADMAKDAFNTFYRYTGQEWLDKKLTGGLISNTVNGVIDNVANFYHGLNNMDWVQMRDAGLGILMTAVAVIAIMSGNPYLIAAGIIMLDAQYNQGQLLAKTIDIAGNIEEALFNTNYIETYAAEIQIAITVAASIYAGQYSMPIIFNATGISGLAASWAAELNYLKAGYGGYQTYMAVQSILDSQEYWKAKLHEYMEALNTWTQQQKAARAQWFEMMTNSDLINRIQAGGDMFIMGAGHDMWSMTSVAEPTYALGIVNTSDAEMDNLINNRYYGQMAGNDGFKPA